MEAGVAGEVKESDEKERNARRKISSEEGGDKSKEEKEEGIIRKWENVR